MQIILQEDVEKLGNRGELVEVAPGYARNFLLPRKLGIEATPGNMKRLERMRVTFAKKEATEKGAAQTLADSLQGVSLSFARKAGDNEQLFGSVTSSDIVEALEAQGYRIDKRKITLPDPIKVVGDYEVPVKLHREIVARSSLKLRSRSPRKPSRNRFSLHWLQSKLRRAHPKMQPVFFLFSPQQRPYFRFPVFHFS